MNITTLFVWFVVGIWLISIYKEIPKSFFIVAWLMLLVKLIEDVVLA